MFRLPSDTILTIPLIDRFIEKNRAEAARRKKLFDYYKGKQAIMSRVIDDPSKPNNHIANPYPNYITNMFCGYFVGKPIGYKSDDDAMLQDMEAIFSYNDEAAENSGLAKDASVCGVAYELLYLDADKQIRFKKIAPENCIPIYDTTLDEDLLYFIRYYDEEDILTDHKITYVEVYDRTNFTLYKKDVGSMVAIQTYPHNFGMVPIAIYENNEELMGDFEIVLPLIDSYDKTVSDSVNDLEYFVNAYLVLYGALGTTAEDIDAMKENRVLLMDTDCKAEWLTKQANDVNIENIKTTVDDNIHKFSGCPNLTDINFSGDASGVAIKYKLIGFENATAKKEGSFKKGLQRRMELICNMLSLMGSSYNYRDIEIVFTRNLPENATEMADLLQKVGYLLSKETQMTLLPLDIDVDAEKERLKSEREEEYLDGWEDNDVLAGQSATE